MVLNGRRSIERLIGFWLAVMVLSILGDQRMNRWFQIQFVGDVPGVPTDLLMLRDLS